MPLLMIYGKGMKMSKLQIGDFVSLVSDNVSKQITRIIVPLAYPEDRIIHVVTVDGVNDWHREHYLIKRILQKF